MLSESSAVKSVLPCPFSTIAMLSLALNSRANDRGNLWSYELKKILPLFRLEV